MSKRPLILVSNDDSYSAKGVHELIDRLVKFGDVVAVCPQHPQSGQSMALTVNNPLRITMQPDYNGARMYHVSGTPVDCIKLSMHYILDRKPDLVVTGINHGSNSAINVLYSGTMGAAMEGCAFGIPSIGFSLTDHSGDADFTPCHKAIDILVEHALLRGMPQDICLNVNVPNIKGEPECMRKCVPCRGHWNDEYAEYTDPYGKKFYWLTGKYENEEPDNELTDEWALSHGMISVVPVSIERSQSAEVTIDWLDEAIDLYNSHKNQGKKCNIHTF
ncbi:MAG: 5'/3'-nucleotidase SurE [Candidatus Amulumruptor caecigallinarius]|nr:5'/3'-nucleotidase SurE [Candidatus Amulumruptor caecigallinarius]